MVSIQRKESFQCSNILPLLTSSGRGTLNSDQTLLFLIKGSLTIAYFWTTKKLQMRMNTYLLEMHLKAAQANNRNLFSVSALQQADNKTKCTLRLVCLHLIKCVFYKWREHTSNRGDNTVTLDVRAYHYRNGPGSKPTKHSVQQKCWN